MYIHRACRHARPFEVFDSFRMHLKRSRTSSSPLAASRPSAASIAAPALGGAAGAVAGRFCGRAARADDGAIAARRCGGGLVVVTPSSWAARIMFRSSSRRTEGFAVIRRERNDPRPSHPARAHRRRTPARSQHAQNSTQINRPRESRRRRIAAGVWGSRDRSARAVASHSIFCRATRARTLCCEPRPATAGRAHQTSTPHEDYHADVRDATSSSCECGSSTMKRVVSTFGSTTHT